MVFAHVVFAHVVFAHVVFAHVVFAIKEHQEAYGILYSRHLLLHNEVTDANQIIQCLRAEKSTTETSPKS